MKFSFERRKISYHIFFLSVLLLIGVEIFGAFGLGAKRWIKILGVSIQPSELIKVTMILALSKYYHDLKYFNIRKLHHLIIPLIIIFTPF